MSVDDEVRDALSQIEGAAHLYAVTENSIGRYTDLLGQYHPDDRDTYACARLDAILTEIAYDHRLECNGGDCRTCAGMQEALTMAVASVRAMLAAAHRPQRRNSGRRWRRPQ
ncbi:hypothetical protein [Actinoplanes aureus]|uniref:Uncharacterized protein n=1 Tax=Actinoplanes aureus TaxID=2792083 RepID=A0A931CDT3_9ACTN|nr:hypothetical protein [Actinoplanes aureus]MBG0565461.1 hypothetical protein [Actinoplanes aureus]